MSTEPQNKTSVRPYGPAIVEAISTGDLAKMKEVAAAAEEHLAQYGDVGRLLQHLKIEIAKAEASA
ncbi:hypothetical protein VY88_32805 [Azospirillum thiophilum]|uniref:DUF1843 domain-containing protein n=1 Tax=Azospirillum thiophilum TaxID=528244 RepID=A0AAC8VZY8_9PROT|nr:DUF1843 domain-containing protein [Azospirillum thiophilum]ALG72497.1 hypothetical protein AL072_15520 [Azospirillum thiophilum]KJR61458.1 hypothetical protein VY88_32805 [Azospirillum thiophilum]